MSYTIPSSLPYSSYISTKRSSKPISSSALDFLVAITSADLHVYNSATLGLLRFGTQRAGAGGFSKVDIGYTTNKKPVAVKRCHYLKQTLLEGEGKNTFERDLHQFCLELRILTLSSVRHHANIIDILGWLVDEYSGQPSLGLVLEYSPFGTLTAFLKEHKNTTSIADCTEFVFQAAKGLEMLHGLKICHGDVKAQNALVFREKDEWQIKLSDFGQSILPLQGDHKELSDIPPGTALLNAPEVRDGTARCADSFTIEDAILTDIFSFGLLTWEVLKHGECFFDSSWIGPADEAIDTAEMVTYISSLAPNELYEHSLEFLRGLDLDPVPCKQISTVFEYSLQDESQQRRAMSSIVKALDQREILVVATATHIKALNDNGLPPHIVPAWTASHSLYDVIESGIVNCIIVDELPFRIQQQVLSELQQLFVSEDMPDSIRAHAALTVSECYTIAFGTDHDNSEVVRWLLNAATLGHSKAIQWYHRVCYACGLPAASIADLASMEELEKELALLPADHYLTSRIQRLEAARVRLAKDSILRAGDLDMKMLRSGFCYPLKFFNPWTVDEIMPLHFAAWTGNDAAVMDLLKSTPVNTLSMLGFSAIHFACLGGHLAVLRLLIDNHASVSIRGFCDITPLHLCIYFPPIDTQAAVDMLIENGASANEESVGAIIWTDHDIDLTGNPLDWAVLTRNKRLVEALLPHSQSHDCLGIALGKFFYEIVDLLLQYCEDAVQIFSDAQGFDTIKRPFSHWIAHGPHHLDAISRTFQVCNQRGLPEIELENGNTPLMDIMNIVRVEDDFFLVEEIMSSMISAKIKQTNTDNFSALLYALSRAKHQTLWEKILQIIVGQYSIEELQEETISGGSYLHFAVTCDSVVGARALLERGADVNQLTFDEIEVPPLHLCMNILGSPSMYALLTKYGARRDLENRVSGANAIQDRLLGLQPNSALLDIAIQDAGYESFSSETLHALLWVFLAPRPPHRRDTHDAFAYILRTESAVQFINSKDANHATLLVTAAFNLHYDSVALLLEAGADVNIPLQTGNIRAFPLQIACAVGRLLWMCYYTGREDIMREKREGALRVATKLLQWHQMKRDGPFQGITPLHLASHMGISSEIRRLLKSYDSHAKGNWPSIDHEVYPLELIEADLEDDYNALKLIQFDTLGIEKPKLADWAEEIVSSFRFEGKAILANRASIREELSRSNRAEAHDVY